MAQDYYANKYGIQLEEFLIWGSKRALKQLGRALLKQSL